MLNNKVRILLVDDQELQKTIVEDSIEELQEKENVEIELHYSDNYSNALENLLKNDYDAAIIDLKLDEKTVDHTGNDLIEIIVNKLRLPVIVCSGFPEHFDNNIIDENNGFFALRKKDDDMDELISQIIKWYKSGFTKIFGKDGVWEEQLNSIFWTVISKNIEEWSKYQGKVLNNGEEVNINHEKALLRYSLNIMQTFLELNSDKTDYDLLHPAEFYIMPPLYDNFMFGDIIQDETSKEIFAVLTPACEMANKKFSKVLIAEIKDLLSNEKFKTDYEKHSKIIFAEEGANPQQKQSAINKLGKWYRNGHDSSNGIHFLPKYGDFRGGFIDFQCLKTIPDLELKTNYTRLATISVHFAKDIGSRFSSYYARQGQPSLADDIISFSLRLEGAL